MDSPTQLQNDRHLQPAAELLTGLELQPVQSVLQLLFTEVMSCATQVDHSADLPDGGAKMSM